MTGTLPKKRRSGGARGSASKRVDFMKEFLRFGDENGYVRCSSDDGVEVYKRDVQYKGRLILLESDHGHESSDVYIHAFKDYMYRNKALADLWYKKSVGLSRQIRIEMSSRNLHTFPFIKHDRHLYGFTNGVLSTLDHSFVSYDELPDGKFLYDFFNRPYEGTSDRLTELNGSDLL